jgi:lipoprotein-anchoring transpeptidase ErfK/SrfK
MRHAAHRIRPLVLLFLGALSALALACGGEEEAPLSEEEAIDDGGADAVLTETFDTPMPPPDGPQLVATSLATIIYEQPSNNAAKVGYLRVGERVARSKAAVSYEGCEYGWYRVRPVGYVCVGDRASLYLQHPIARALGKLPDLSKPLPYRYAFVRAIAPNYLRVPTKAEQLQYEFQLEKHLRSYGKLRDKWQAVDIGANDVPLDATGVAIGAPPKEPPALGYSELFGGNGEDIVPWWLDGGRKIPHLSAYKAPRYAVIAGRVRRFTGVAVIDSFVPGDAAGQRRMAVTADGRLIPVSKLKPNTGSTWHGVPLGARTGLELPLGFVTNRKGAEVFDLTETETNKLGEVPFRATVNLNGKVRTRQGKRYVQLKNGSWIISDDAAIAALPSKLPSFARGQQKWIDLSIVSQTMVAWEGQTPVYVTMVSTGKDGMGDPKKSHSTVRGTFRIREKHVTTTMDSDDVGDEFELRDVPWVQYFHHGYAIHAAYWHDDYGKVRSHGCVNMSPIDARWFFFWTTPGLPEGWHGVWNAKDTGEGTIVHIHA